MPLEEDEEWEVEFDDKEIGYQVVLEDEDPEPDGRDDIDPFTRLPVETMLLNIASLVFLLMKTWQTNIPSP